jgi:hypothetical protein
VPLRPSSSLTSWTQSRTGAGNCSSRTCLRSSRGFPLRRFGSAKMSSSLCGAAVMMIQRFTVPESHGGKDFLTDWWSAEGFEFSEAKPLPVKPDVCRPCAYLDPLVQYNHLCTQTVRGNGGLRQLPRGRYASAYIHLWPTDGELSFVSATARAITESMSSTVGKLLDMAKTRTDSTPRQWYKTLVSESGPWANMGQVAMATMASIAAVATWNLQLAGRIIADCVRIPPLRHPQLYQ